MWNPRRTWWSETVALLVALGAALPAQESSSAPRPGVVLQAAEPLPALDEEARGLVELVRAVRVEEGSEAARDVLAEIVADLGTPAAGEERLHVAFLLALDQIAVEIASPTLSLRLREEVVAQRGRFLNEEHPDYLRARQDLGIVLAEAGNAAAAHEQFEAVLEVCNRLLPPEHDDVLSARQNLGGALLLLDDYSGAEEHLRAVLAARQSKVSPDHPSLHGLLENLAMTRSRQGDLTGAHALALQVLTARERVLGPDHPQVLQSKYNLATIESALGDQAAALARIEEVLAIRARDLPADHRLLFETRASLALICMESGDIERAVEVQEELLRTQRRTLAPDSLDLLRTLQNTSIVREMRGDLVGARELAEEAFATHGGGLPAGQPLVLDVRLHLAQSRYRLGDFVAARELLETLLADLAELPPEHALLVSAQESLALVLEAEGDLEGARTLQTAVLEARAQRGSNAPGLLAVAGSLAEVRRRLGDLAGARALQEQVLAARERLVPEHPDRLAARNNLGRTLLELGDADGARELFESVLEVRARLLPMDHPHLLLVLENLARTRLALGDVAGARELMLRWLAGLRRRGETLLAESGRLARSAAREELASLSSAIALSATPAVGQGLEGELFATLAALRLASQPDAAISAALAGRPALAEAGRQSFRARSRLHDLASVGPPNPEGLESWRAELLRLSEERDRAERLLRSALTEAGVRIGTNAAALGQRLAAGSAAVTYVRYARTPDSGAATDALLALLVLPGGVVRRIELGPFAAVEQHIADWRVALGRPLSDRGLGLAAVEPDPEALARAGERLRACVLDPVLALAAEVTVLHVELDDALFLVALDALPLGAGRVGERLHLHHEVSLARLLVPERPLPEEGELLLVGGIDYDASPGEPPRVDAAAVPCEAPGERGASQQHLAYLPGTEAECAAIAALYEEAFARPAVRLTGAGATKLALHGAVSRARQVHLATHGWFAGEAFRAELPAPRAAESRARPENARGTWIGLAPETLCGLALAGANRGRDALGRVPGILSAEELAALDLSGCELAVLSACETQVGIRRAGQGLQSLQSALHSAGARTTITSLWSVDDAATRRLFELFYACLWQQGLGKAEALWRAKMSLRAEGYAERDWAGWLLSGDPD